MQESKIFARSNIKRRGNKKLKQLIAPMWRTISQQTARIIEIARNFRVPTYNNGKRNWSYLIMHGNFTVGKIRSCILQMAQCKTHMISRFRLQKIYVDHRWVQSVQKHDYQFEEHCKSWSPRFHHFFSTVTCVMRRDGTHNSTIFNDYKVRVLYVQATKHPMTTHHRDLTWRNMHMGDWVGRDADRIQHC